VELARRRAEFRQRQSKDIFSARIVCGHCGAFFGRKTWHPDNPKYRTVLWQCNSQFSKEDPHPSNISLKQEEIEKAYVMALNRLMGKRQEIKKDFEEIKAIVYDTTGLSRKMADLESTINGLASAIRNLTESNCISLQNQEDYNRRFAELTDKYDAARNSYASIRKQIEDKNARRIKAESFIRSLEEMDGPFSEFKAELWTSLLDKMVVNGKGDFTFRFKDGTEIKQITP
jgi:site-specific DNA recombinase